jgi:hypothetical protein
VTGSASSRPPKGPERSIVSLVLQRSIIELFAAYNVAVAPVSPGAGAARGSRPADHLVGMVQVNSGNRRGLLTLSTSPRTLSMTRQTEPDMPAQLDWIRELTNQFAGRVKAKFARYNLLLQVGLPTALSSSAMDRNHVVEQADLVLVFHTLRDQILCTLSGGFDDTGLLPRGDPTVAGEGDVILF